MKRARRANWIWALALCACAGSPSTPREPAPVGEYHVAPPDILAITVRPEAGEPREVTVRPDGQISFDLIGDVVVEGRTVREIQQEITRRMSEFVVSPNVTVELLQSNSRRFYVFGQVRRPGAFPLIGRVTVVEALAQAGGETQLANRNSARLVRPSVNGEGGGVYPIRYDDIIGGGDGITDHELQPGDIIDVPPGIPARIGFGLQALLYPIQAIIGLGGPLVRSGF